MYNKFQKYDILAEFNPDQAIINKYESGQGIGRHADHKKLFGGIIACITIGNGADLIFRHTDQVKTIHTDPGSCYVMSEDARWKWTHEMPKRKLTSPRYSITFRTVNQEFVSEE